MKFHTSAIEKLDLWHLRFVVWIFKIFHVGIVCEGYNKQHGVPKTDYSETHPNFLA